MTENSLNIDTLPMWARSGRFIGYRIGDHLWAKGKTIGRFRDDDKIYSSRGQYIGEYRDGRVVYDPAKARQRGFGFVTKRAPALLPKAGIERKPMIAGFQDFSLPE